MDAYLGEGGLKGEKGQIGESVQAMPGNPGPPGTSRLFKANCKCFKIQIN